MPIQSEAARERAIESTCQLADETETSCQVAAEDDWFGRIARPLLNGADAGFVLHTLTGISPGTCGRYVSKSASSHRQPPGYFICSLLKSKQGLVWLAALLGDDPPEWWRDLETARRIAKVMRDPK